MKILTFTAAIIAASLIADFTSAGDLSVKISGINSADGTVRVALHNGGKGFPFKRQSLDAKEVPSKPGAVVVTFRDLAPGDYAISFFHDENGNKELDTNLVGLPKEGYGFSNNARGTFGPPKFTAARFQVGEADVVISVDVGY